MLFSSLFFCKFSLCSVILGVFWVFEAASAMGFLTFAEVNRVRGQTLKGLEHLCSFVI